MMQERERRRASVSTNFCERHRHPWNSLQQVVKRSRKAPRVVTQRYGLLTQADASKRLGALARGRGASTSPPRPTTFVDTWRNWSRLRRTFSCGPADVDPQVAACRTRFMEYRRGSLRPDVGRPDHLAPFLGFVGDELSEFAR